MKSTNYNYVILVIIFFALVVLFASKYHSSPSPPQITVTRSIENMINRNMIDNNKRIMLVKNSVEIKKNNKKRIYFGIRNNEKDETSFDIEFKCIYSKMNESVNLNDITFDTFSETKILKRDEITALPADIKVSPNAVATTYVCKVLINNGDYASEIFYINVTK